MTFQHAYFENLDTRERMQVQFNPTELNFSKSAQFADIPIPGLDAPVQQFIRGGTETLTVELFFDSTDNGMGEGARSVTEDNNALLPIDRFCGTDKFYQLVKQNSNTHAPPRCRFSWGESSNRSKPPVNTALEAPGQNQVVSKAPFWFICIVESIDRKFLLFSPEGVPLRARLTVKLREYQTIEQMVARLNSADHTKARIFKQRDRLDRISASEYNTPAEWRRIAEENDIDDPRRIPPGTNLVIPPIRVDSIVRKPRSPS